MRLSPFYQLLLLAFVTLGVYYPTLFAPYNSLDDQVFVNYLLNQQGFSWARHFSPGGIYDYYRPLLSLTFEIDKHVGGLQEPFMHLVNILVHLLNVILIWLVARRVGELTRRPSQWLPLLAALLFALHPINTEAVNWIAGRTDLLAGTFVFFSLYALLVAVERGSLLWGAVSAIAVLGGALCKETALFIIPGAVFLLFCCLGSNRPVRNLRWVLPSLYGVSVSIYFVLRWGAFQTDRGLANTAKLASQTAGIAISAGGGAPIEAAVPFPWFDAALTAFKTSGFYACKLFQPLPLNFAIHRVDDGYLIPGIVLFAGLVVIAFRRRVTGWLFLLSASIAVSALLVLFTRLAWTPVAERYMYIPCGPFVVGCVYAIEGHIKHSSWQRAATFLVLLLIVFWGGNTANRNVVWQDNLTLYQDTVRQSPDFAPARNQLALALLGHNRREEAQEILASNIVPNGDAASLNVAATLYEQGDYAAARAELMQRLVNTHGYQEVKILEMLIKITSTYLEEIENEKLKRNGYEDIVGWLQRVNEISPSGFNFYRIGRVYLILDNKLAAQKAFAEAAMRLPRESIYRGPATKLARDLAR